MSASGGTEIGGATRVACVIGDPGRALPLAAHAQRGLGGARARPHLRRAARRARRPRRCRARPAGARRRGVNVTVPHKAAAAALCDVLGSEARDAGAVNTLSFPQTAALRGDLTDGLGLLAALPAVPERAVLLGAGGSARAAGAALLRAGTRRLTIVARRVEAADRLADALAGLDTGAEVERGGRPCPPQGGGLLVHCTPVGGIAALKQLPAPADVIERMDAVADFAYRADGSPTPLAEVALAAGLPLVDGLELLVRQGALSFERWTGCEPPLDVMRRAARGE